MHKIVIRNDFKNQNFKTKVERRLIKIKFFSPISLVLFQEAVYP